MAKLSADEAALLKAVCRNPADDLPRLVYADWLEERGRPDRAEFIRLQCESAAAGFPGVPFERAGDFDPRQPRVNELWRANRQNWLRELPRWAIGRDPPPFVRGFPERFVMVAAPFLRYGPQLLDRAPVRAVRLTQLRNVVGELIRCVWLQEVPAIDLSGELIGDARVKALTEAEWLTATRHLDLSENNLYDPAARYLARCPRLGSVATLRLRGNHLTADGVQTLASSRYLDPRAVIDLRGNRPLVYNPEVVRRVLGRRGLV